MLEARRAVARENRQAASDRSLDPRDPRWLVALETASNLEGPILSFERRRRVLAFAQRVGVRAFDANLIIAAVQDRARRGEGLHEARSVVALTARPTPTRRWWPYAAVGGFAAIAHIAVLAWLLR